jgi:ABC-type amino acid transport substrate-binding protein
MTWLLSVVAIGLVAASAPRVATSRGSLARLGVLVSLPILAACNAVSERSPIQTLVPGVVKIAVTDTTVTDPLDPGQWMYRYAERLGRELDLRIEWVVVPFDKSWELAGKDVVDVVATNLASFSDRVSPGGTFSTPFLYEQRALRIRAADRSQYRTIADFVGKRVGAVTGMAAERDLLQRAPPGVQILSTMTFPELYELFDLGQLDAVAEAEYFTLDGRVIPSHGPDIALIDHHDLSPGQREESVFVVRDKSKGLLEAVNAFVARTPFPLHLTHQELDARHEGVPLSRSVDPWAE